MKIEFAEQIIKKFGGEYNYYYSDDLSNLFVDITTDKVCLFKDDIKYIKRTLKRYKAELSYISIGTYESDTYRNFLHRQKLCCTVRE